MTRGEGFAVEVGCELERWSRLFLKRLILTLKVSKTNKRPVMNDTCRIEQIFNRKRMNAFERKPDLTKTLF